MNNLYENFYDDTKLGDKQPTFKPYADNGGSVVAIAGDDYVVIGADTRLSVALSSIIYTREQKKLFKLSEQTVLGATGCWCDVLTITRLVQARMRMYEYDQGTVMPTSAVAQMVSTMLYYKRFFPYSIHSTLVGLDADGRGCVYSYDAVGCCEKCNYRAGGSAGSQLQPLLDNQIGLKNMQHAAAAPLTRDKALALLRDAFISAAERDVCTGDGIIVHTITADGIEEEKFELRKD